MDQRNDQQRYSRRNVDDVQRRYRRSRRRRKNKIQKLIINIIKLILLVLIVCSCVFIIKKLILKDKPATTTETVESTAESTETTIDAAAKLDEIIAHADLLAAGYDYEAAIQYLEDNREYDANNKIDDAIAGYRATMDTLVEADLSKVTHIFFHSLIMDNSKALDGDSKTTGYNEVMTTKSEFMKIIQEMYNRGYVLVKIHDLAHEENDENGQPHFVKGKIMLPEGKKPFVLSQDDVNYYEYMEGDGFANRLVIGEDGRPTCEMDMDDGSVSVGSYDLVPLIEDFVKEHPDFSYRGARGIVAVTGYNGVFGYRTDSSYNDTNPNIEKDRETVKEVAQCLRDNGWELSSHSWGHPALGISSEKGKKWAISDERFHTDTDRWENEVETLIGETDIMIYPKGNDLTDWHNYTDDNERYQYLHSKGFRYFCNVDASTPYWTQMGHDYFRMARRNLDGYRLYEDMVQTDPAKKRLTDLFDAAEVFDHDRPTPITWSY